MRLCIALVIVFAACNQKAEAPATATGAKPSAATGSAPGAKAAGSASEGSAMVSGSAGSGSAAAPAKPAFACFPIEDGRHMTRFAADDRSATVCTMPESAGDDDAKQPPPQCLTVDLATGTWRDGTPPPPATPSPAAFEVKQDAKAVQVCKGTACTKLAIRPLKLEGEETGQYMAAVSDDGKRAILASDSINGAWLFDATTGKKVKELKLVEPGGGCMNTVAFLGQLVYIAVDVCAGPGAEGALYTWAGKQVGKIDKVNPYGMQPIHVGGDNYAIGDLDGSTVAFVDATTAKPRAVSLPEIACEDCSPIGEGVHWGDPPLVKTPSGKLVAVSSKLLAVIDPATRKIEKQHRLPICPKAK
jgi:hypothetical protein